MTFKRGLKYIAATAFLWTLVSLIPIEHGSRLISLPVLLSLQSLRITYPFVQAIYPPLRETSITAYQFLFVLYIWLATTIYLSLIFSIIFGFYKLFTKSRASERAPQTVKRQLTTKGVTADKSLLRKYLGSLGIGVGSLFRIATLSFIWTILATFMERKIEFGFLVYVINLPLYLYNSIFPDLLGGFIHQVFIFFHNQSAFLGQAFIVFLIWLATFIYFTIIYWGIKSAYARQKLRQKISGKSQLN